MENKEIWVKLEERFDGMFDEEYGASLKLYDGKLVSFFVNKSLF